MKYRATICFFLMISGVILTFVLPWSQLSIGVGFMLAANILYLHWPFYDKAHVALCKAIDLSAKRWALAYTNAEKMTSEPLLLSLQNFDRPNEWIELLVYPNHPEFDRFCALRSPCIFNLAFRPPSATDINSTEALAYLSILDVIRPGMAV